MDAVYEELDEVKSEIEKLREQYRVKTELAENLRKAHDDQLSRNKEFSSKLNKLAQELNEKDNELLSMKQMNEDLKSTMKEKESIMKHVTGVNDKLRANKDAGSELEKLSRVLSEKEDELFVVKKSNEDLKLTLKEKESILKNLSDRLRVSKEERSQLEKITQQLSDKEDQLFTAQQLNHELKSKLKEKESIIKQITSAHDKLRVEWNEKLRKCDEENKALVFALDEANVRNVDQEQQNRVLKEEIEGVRRLVAVSQKKLSESVNSSKISKEAEQREDVFLKLEEDNRKIEDQLKWKKEQFGHLEESHKKLQNEFKARERKWEKEKSVLIDDLSSLQSKLESQIRISQDLQRRLEMCEQALAHSESKRKLVEAELLESRVSFDSVCGEYDQAKLNFEILTSQRDQEIANLRSSLSTKEILYKEMEYQFRRVELEKQELLSSLKELQEDQIREARISSSASKLQNKLKSLEREHRGCLANLKEKELEWRSQMEKLAEELNSCRSELKSQDVTITKLETELEACDSLMLKLEMLNQETSLMLFILRSEFSEAQLRLADANSYMDSNNHENMSALIEQLEKKKVALSDMRVDLEEEREKVSILSEKVQTLEGLQLPLQKELDRLRETLEESSTSRVQSDEQVLQLQSDLEKVKKALERANNELYEKFCEANEIEFELHLWKSIAEQLEATMKLNHQMRREVEASLLAQVEVETNLKQEKESLSHLLEEKERRIEDLEQQLVEVSQSIVMVDEHILSPLRSDSSGAEARIEAYTSNEPEEKENFHNFVVEEEKDHRIGDLQQVVMSLENEFESSTSSFYSRLSRMQKEMNSLRRSLEKIKEMEILKEFEIQEKNLIIEELEDELEDLRERVEQQDKALFGSESELRETKEELVKKEMQTYRLKHELEEKIENSNRAILKLTEDNRNMSLKSMKLISTMQFLSEKIDVLTVEDTQLTESLEKLVQNFGTERAAQVDDDDIEQENIKVFSSPSVKKVETIYEERSPFRAINT